MLLAAAASAQEAAPDSAELERLIVTPTRRATGEDPPANASRVGSEDIERVAATHVSEILARVPGVWISRGSGQEHLTAIRSPVLTGAGSCGAFLFLADGVPIRPAGFCNVNQLFEINTEQAAAIEVLRGPGTALYGSDALHGTINVLMPGAPAGRTAGAAIEAGPDDYYRARFDVGGGSGTDRGWRLLANGTHGGDFREQSGFAEAKLNLIHERPLAGGDLKIQLAGTHLEQETAGFILGRDSYRDSAARAENLNPEAYRDADSERLTAHWQGDLTDTAELHLRPYVRRSRMDFLQHFLPGKPLEENGQKSAGLLLSVDRPFADGSLLILGFDMEAAEGFLTETQPGPVEDGSPSLIETRPPGAHYDYEVDTRLIAPYVHGEWHIRPRLALTAGARLEHLEYDYDNRLAPGNLREDGTPCGFGGCLFNRPADRTDSFTNFAPKLGLAWEPTRADTVRLTLARGFRAPQATELYRLQSGQNVADLDSEVLDSLELGWRRAGTRFDLALTAFYSEKDHVIFRDAEGFNVSDGRTRHAGVEAEAGIALGGDFTLFAAGTYARHRYAFTRMAARGESISSGNDVDTAPRTIGNARLLWTPPYPVSAELEWVHLGGYYLDAENRHRYPGHDLLNLRAAYRLSPRWTVAARLTNLTDRAYADRADFAFGDFRYFPGHDRALYVELAWSDGP